MENVMAATINNAKQRTGADELEALANNAGVKTEFDGLNPEAKDTISAATYQLQQISRLGLKIEDDDKTNLGTITELQKTLQVALQDLDQRYHPNQKWLLDCLNHLVLAAATNQSERADHQERVVAKPKDYLTDLIAAGEKYQPSVRAVGNHPKAEEYLDRTRPPQIAEIDDRLQRLTNIVHALPTSN